MNHSSSAPKQKVHSPDILVRNEGSIFLLHPLTAAGQGWLTKNIDPNAMTFGEAIVVEGRYISDILGGIQGDGLTVGEE